MFSNKVEKKNAFHLENLASRFLLSISLDKIFSQLCSIVLVVFVLYLKNYISKKVPWIVFSRTVSNSNYNHFFIMTIIDRFLT